MKTATDHKEIKGNELYRYMTNENWDKAKNLIENELKNYPDDHFLITQMGEVYYEMREYDKALQWTKKAVELAPQCPLALNNYAVALLMHEKNTQAIQIWQKLLHTDLNELAYGHCGEGMQFAKSLINDIRFRMGDAYLAENDTQKALFFYKKHLENRKRGLFSNFTKREVENEIKQLEKQVNAA